MVDTIVRPFTLTPDVSIELFPSVVKDLTIPQNTTDFMTIEQVFKYIATVKLQEVLNIRSTQVVNLFYKTIVKHTYNITNIVEVDIRDVALARKDSVLLIHSLTMIHLEWLVIGNSTRFVEGDIFSINYKPLARIKKLGFYNQRISNKTLFALARELENEALQQNAFNVVGHQNRQKTRENLVASKGLTFKRDRLKKYNPYAEPVHELAIGVENVFPHTLGVCEAAISFFVSIVEKQFSIKSFVLGNVPTLTSEKISLKHNKVLSALLKRYKVEYRIDN